MTDVLTGATPTDDKLTGSTTLQFREEPIPSTIKSTGMGDVDKVGDVVSETADLFDDNNVLVGTKDVYTVFFKQLKNGDIIGNINEIYHLPNGEIFTHGTFDNTKFEIGIKPIETRIIGGSGTYSNVYGKETITNLLTNTPGEVSTRLDIHL